MKWKRCSGNLYLKNDSGSLSLTLYQPTVFCYLYTQKCCNDKWGTSHSKLQCVHELPWLCSFPSFVLDNFAFILPATPCWSFLFFLWLITLYLAPQVKFTKSQRRSQCMIRSCVLRIMMKHQNRLGYKVWRPDVWGWNMLSKYCPPRLSALRRNWLLYYRSLKFYLIAKRSFKSHTWQFQILEIISWAC